jgi:hypothetical protein
MLLSEILRRLLLLDQRQKRLARRLQMADTSSQDLSFALARLIREIGVSASPSSAAAARGTGSRRRRDAAGDSGPVVTKVTFTRGASGSYKVCFDGGLWFPLCPSLSTLLLHLSRADGTCSGSLVPWKSEADLRQALSAEDGRPVSKRALVARVNRLRDTIALHTGLGREVIQTRGRPLGYRLALKHPAPPVTGADWR